MSMLLMCGGGASPGSHTPGQLRPSVLQQQQSLSHGVCEQQRQQQQQQQQQQQRHLWPKSPTEKLQQLQSELSKTAAELQRAAVGSQAALGQPNSLLGRRSQAASQAQSPSASGLQSPLRRCPASVTSSHPHPLVQSSQQQQQQQKQPCGSHTAPVCQSTNSQCTSSVGRVLNSAACSLPRREPRQSEGHKSVSPLIDSPERSKGSSSTQQQALEKRIAWLEEDLNLTQSRLRQTYGARAEGGEGLAAMQATLQQLAEEFSQELSARKVVEEQVAQLEATLAKERADRVQVLNKLCGQLKEVMEEIGMRLESRLVDENSMLMKRSSKIDLALKGLVTCIEERLADGAFSMPGSWVPLAAPASDCSRGDRESSPSERSVTPSCSSAPSHVSSHPRAANGFFSARPFLSSSAGLLKDSVAAAAAEGQRAADMAASALMRSNLLGKLP
eukprot:TRINITY_DN8370_c1_g1_i1.p1 TRINITY_DN8370_c1_g1~~TRINITY_DN8370_c1_g1_i1.p1  ORF type:complete len:445 (+),score=101.91 TRINITY_DN8370_c1_g1_i1:82-1416(+)